MDEFLEDRHEIAEQFERLLTDIMNEATSQIDALLQEDATLESILFIIAAMFSDIREEYFEAYEDIAEPIIARLRDKEFFVDPDDDTLDLLEDLKDEHLAVLDTMERDWTDRVEKTYSGINIPGVESEDLFSYITRTRDEYGNEIIGNTDIFHRVMSDVMTGGMLVVLGGLVLSKNAKNWKYAYLGPKDDRNRPHCARHVGASMTRREIDNISPSQFILAGNDPAVTPAYITTPCRHNWELASK